MTHPLFPAGEAAVSGELQFWRMRPEDWEPALKAIKQLGIDVIATYLSWRRHEPSPGALDFRGTRSPELDVHSFLDLCRRLNVRVILKPGPWICAEEPGGGFPDWILSDAQMMARDYRGEIVRGYNPPFVHPIPSYASQRFRREVRRWVTIVWDELADYVKPGGPIMGTQFDNEPSLGFRDTMYGFDWHEDALRSWSQFSGGLTPPVPRGGDPDATYLEIAWANWQRQYIADYLVWLRDVNAQAGAAHLVGSVNLNTHPVRGWPQDGPVIAERLSKVIVGEDHYFIPPLDEDDLTGLALACAQARHGETPLVWAPEMQAGIWRSPGEHVDYPNPVIEEMAGWWGAALALGYQGFNLYMLVNRENWEAAPIAEDGALTSLGQTLREFMLELGQFPDYREFRPMAEAVVPWRDEDRVRAYRVVGRQADPMTSWDNPLSRALFDASEDAARELTVAGIQFDLSSAPVDPHKARPKPFCEVSHGYLVRVHSHPDGRRLLYVVRWSRDVTEGPRLAFREDADIAVLSRAGSQTRLTDSAVTLPLFHGLRIYEVA